MKEFKGIVVAMVTPFNEDGSVDCGQEEKLIRHFVDKGVNGILVSGGTGEFSSMSLDERKKVIACAAETLKETDVFCIAGISCNAEKDTVELGRFAGEAGVDYVLVLPPHAIPVTRDAMMDYFREVKANTAAGMILYHFPGETNVEFSPEEIVKMGRDGLFNAVKNTTGMEHTMELIVENGHDEGLRLSNGFDSLALAALACGTDAIITSGANMVPAQFVKMYNNIKNNDLKSAYDVYKEIMPLLNLQEMEGNTETGVCKYCLKLQGVDAGVPRKPVPDISEETKREVERLLKKAEAVLG